MKSSSRTRTFLIGAFVGLALGLVYLSTGGDTALPLLGAGPVRTALFYALWSGFAAGGWVYDNVPGGHSPACYLTAGFLALALAYGLLGLVLSPLITRAKSLS